jgi:hypothetical protein
MEPRSSNPAPGENPRDPHTGRTVARKRSNGPGFALPALAALAVLALALSGCSTVESRIEKNPAVFAALPAAEQALVREGKIREGMSREAVGIAWGRPDDRTLGSRDGQTFEEWIYLTYSSYPVARYDYDPICYGDRRFHRAFPRTEYETVTRLNKSVLFRRGRVVASKEAAGW